MKNKWLVAYFLMILLGFILDAQAENELSLEDRARIGEVYSLERMEKYDEAKPIISRLYNQYPDNQEVKWTYARVMGFGGDWKEASVVFEELCAQDCDKKMIETYGHILEAQGPDPETLAQMKELVGRYPDQNKLNAIYENMLSWDTPTSPEISKDAKATEGPQIRNAEDLIGQQKFKEALHELNAILGSSPNDEAALLWKARIFSWQGKLNASTKVYKKLIKNYPDNSLYYRECARVYGWGGRYRTASHLYNKATHRFPDDEALRVEALAKKAYYNNLFFTAEKGYRDWLAIEPDNPEALFDLGQIHARSERYAAAQADYEQLLAKFPDNTQAQTVRDKAQLYANGWVTETGFQYDESDSTLRQADVRLKDIYTQVEKSVLGNMTAGLRVDEMDYFFINSPEEVNRQRYLASLRQSFSPNTFWKLKGGFSDSNEGIKNLYYGKAEAQFPLLTEHFMWNASISRDDFISNAATMSNTLQADEGRLRAVLTPIKSVEFGADGARSHLTDGNDADSWGGDASVHLSFDPRLTLKYRWQDLRYDENRADYFSPHNFISKRVGVEWEKSLTERASYWGTNQAWYRLRYEYIMDPNDVHGHMYAAGIRWDLNKRLTLKGEGQHIMYADEGIYKNNLIIGSVIFAF